MSFTLKSKSKQSRYKKNRVNCDFYVTLYTHCEDICSATKSQRKKKTFIIFLTETLIILTPWLAYITAGSFLEGRYVKRTCKAGVDETQKFMR